MARLIACLALLLAASYSNAWAETLMMPKRDALQGASVVVWGVTGQPNGTPFTLDYGDGTAPTVGNVTDRSYIAFQHTYATSAVFTATLTVGTETATVEVTAFEGPAMLPQDLRRLRINMAIQDGLRFLWTSQASRAANFPNGITTNWGNSFPDADAALIALAFQNHGYRLTNNNNMPTGIYEKYVVRRSLNFVLQSIGAIQLTVQAAGNPCVGPGIEVAPCTGFSVPAARSGYGTAVAMMPFAASGALNRVNTEVAGVTLNKTYGEILQRLSNAQAWGQTDGAGVGRGGWRYNLNTTEFDGSTVGWSVLGFLDAAAAGATVPDFVKTEFAIGLENAHNNNGSLDYVADGNPNVLGNVGIEKAGVILQGRHWLGQSAPFAPGSKSEATVQYISDRWNSGRLAGDFNWACAVAGQNNKGCAYSMFNNFKGLKLQQIATLPGVTRPAGPGAIPAGDWYADYEDWLVANQTNPTALNGGNWAPMLFSCCYGGSNITAAMAELILASVVLVLPDPEKFAVQGLRNTPPTGMEIEGGTHTVTAKAEATNGAPVPGVTVNFVILSGPNAGLTGTDITDANGEATFTYTDGGPDGTVGTDRIQASIETGRDPILSNIVEMIWLPRNQAPVCTAASASTPQIWPANHQFVDIVILDVTDPDGDPLTITVTSVFQDEAVQEDGTGSGSTTPDAQLSPLAVRAERNGNPKTPGDGRVYHINFAATDTKGTSCTGKVLVCVPHDQGKGNTCADGGPLFNSIP